ncbi:hypothetical protein [Sorangium sp. So ce426]|uniref:hypothetical protein n=1 Tax=unclassified Sorangium TaxID=2621164 RepID=UPI003F5BEAFF
MADPSEPAGYSYSGAPVPLDPAGIWDIYPSSPVRCGRHPEQQSDRLVNDPSRHVIPEGDGTAQGAGERGDHRSPPRRLGHGELPMPGA